MPQSTSTSPGDAYIIVGVSPTSGSPEALRWAADEAQYRGVALRAITAWLPQRRAGVTGTRPPLVTMPTLEDHKAEAVSSLLRHVRTHLGNDCDVECLVLMGPTFNVLLDASRRANMLVLGRARSVNTEIRRANLVVARLMARCPCPVTIVPGEPFRLPSPEVT